MESARALMVSGLSVIGRTRGIPPAFSTDRI